jgi:hypothetical protein
MMTENNELEQTWMDIFLFLSTQSESQKNSETSLRRMEQFNFCEQQHAMSLTQGADFDDHHPHHGHDYDSETTGDTYIHN